VEEGADFILTLWRPELDSRKSPVERHDLKGKMDACMVKNRDGETGDVALWFDAETLRIGEREESRRV
jgi:replicative DNA helicase